MDGIETGKPGTPEDAQLRPWYREPWPWIVAAGPAIVVVAGLATFWIAAHNADVVVKDPRAQGSYAPASRR